MTTHRRLRLTGRKRRTCFTGSLRHHRHARSEDVEVAGLVPGRVDAWDVRDEMAEDVAVPRHLVIALADARVREAGHRLGAVAAAGERAEAREEHLDDPRVARRDVGVAGPVVR